MTFWKVEVDSQKHNIVILGPYSKEPGGVGNFLRLLVTELDDSCVDVRYFAIGRRRLLLYSILLPIYLLFDFVMYVIMLSAIAPDVVHINPSLARKALVRDFFYLYISKRMGCKVVFFIHGWHKKVYRFLDTRNQLVKLFLERFFSLPDKIIVLADDFKNQLMEFGIESPKIDVLPIMIEYNKYAKVAQEKEDAKTDILFLANFNFDKGIREVVQAVPIVLRRCGTHRIKFTLAGDGPEMPKVAKMVKVQNISDDVEFTGYVDGQKKYDVFTNANLFVYPTSHGEGFPTVIAEAMAAGLPIIATGVGAIPEVLEDGVNGIILSKPDENELANAIVRLLKNPRLMKKMGERNREKAKDYDVSVVCKRLVEIYNEIIASRN